MALKEEEPGLWRQQKLSSYYLAMLPPRMLFTLSKCLFLICEKKAYLTGFQSKNYSRSQILIFFFHIPLICIISDLIDLYKKGFDSIFKRTGFVVKA